MQFEAYKVALSRAN